MARDTPYHGTEVPEDGQDVGTWGRILEDYFDEIDAKVELRGTLDARPALEDVPEGVKYVVDDGDVEGATFIADGSEWRLMAVEATDVTARDRVIATGSDGNPMTDQDGKVIGELDDEDAAGLVGVHLAETGEVIGVYGETESEDGYGLYTPNDAHVGGTVEADTVESGEVSTDSAESDIYAHVNDRDGDVFTDEHPTRREEFGTHTKIQGYRGTVLGEEYRSWPLERRLKWAGTFPHDRGKARICFSWDVAEMDFYNDVYPLFRDRGIPMTVNCDSYQAHGGDGPVSDAFEFEEIKEMFRHGAEIGIYPMSEDELRIDEIAEQHGDQSVAEFLLAQRRDFEDQGIPITYLQYGKGQGINSSDIYNDTFQSYAIRSLFLASGSGGHRSHSTDTRGQEVIGHPDAWINGDQFDTAAEWNEHIDKIIKVDGTASYLAHWNSPTPDIIEDVLDYAEQKRKDGELEICTRTGMGTLPYELDSMNALADPTFAGSAEYGLEEYWTAAVGDASVASDGGAVGDDYLVLGSNDELRHRKYSLHPDFQNAIIEMQAKAPDGETAEFRVTVNNAGDGASNFRNKDVNWTVDDEWERYYFAYGAMRHESDLLMRIRQESGTVHIDDVRIYPV